MTAPTREELVAILREVEWNGEPDETVYGKVSTCPSCGAQPGSQGRNGGHWDSCRLAAALSACEAGACPTCKALDSLVTEAERVTVERECDGRFSVRWGPEDDAIAFGASVSEAIRAALAGEGSRITGNQESKP